jgi:uncharacterized protein (TIGR03086 family)
MTADYTTASPGYPAGLLDRAISYAISAVQDVMPGLLRRPTPCQAWDLDTLLRHASESLATLREAIDTAAISLYPATSPGMTGDPARAFRDQARRLLHAWATTGGHRPLINVAGNPLPASVMEAAGAIEIATHAWDISQASGHHRPIPPALASDLLAIAPRLIPPNGRHPLFAARVAVPPETSPSDQLVAFLGRAPRTTYADPAR